MGNQAKILLEGLLGLMGGVSSAPVVTFASYLASLGIISHRYNEPSGTVATNEGSNGASGNGAYTNVTLAQVGQLGPTDAILINVDGRVVVPLHASFSALTSFEDVFLINTSAYISTAFIAAFGNGAHFVQYFGTSGAMRATVDCLVLDATVTTSTAVKLALNTWNLLFFSYDDGTKRVRLRIGAGGVVTDCAYSTDTAGIGAVQTMIGDLYIANRQALDSEISAKLDHYSKVGRVLTAQERLDLVALAGV